MEDQGADAAQRRAFEPAQPLLGLDSFRLPSLGPAPRRQSTVAAASAVGVAASSNRYATSGTALRTQTSFARRGALTTSEQSSPSSRMRRTEASHAPPFQRQAYDAESSSSAARSNMSTPVVRPITAQSGRTTTAGRPTTAASNLGLTEGAWISAVLENRGTGREVGIAAMEKTTGHCVLTQFADTQTYVKTLHHLTLHSSSVILVPATSVSSSSHPDPQHRGKATEASVLVRSLEDVFEMSVTPLERRDWSAEDGTRMFDKLLVDDAHSGTSDDSSESSREPHSEIGGEATTRSAILTATADRYYALSACCALFRYLERSNNRAFASRSLRIRYAAPEGSIFIDTHSARDLELTANALDRKSNDSLLGVLDHTRTPMARRLLIMNLLAPLTDEPTINSRLDTVEEIITDEDRHFAIRESLASLGKLNVDLDKLINLLLTPEPRQGAGEPIRTDAKLGQLLSLHGLLHAIMPVRSALRGARSGILRAVETFLSSKTLDEITDLIDEAINPDLMSAGSKSSLASRNARVYAVKALHNPLLDVARETYKENIGDIYELVKEYCERYKLNLVLKQLSTGFILELPASDGFTARDLPPEFTNVNKIKSGKSYTMTTLDLKKRNQRVTDSLNEVLLLSTAIVSELRGEIVARVSALYKVSEALALLDMLASFAHCVDARRFVRPEITGTLAIKGGRHPILDAKLRSSVVPNDAYVAEGQSFFIITGPNFAGKTTYLRQVAMLQIMASIGSFVPAEYASFATPDCILTRLSNDDDQEHNLSTFAAEMQSAAFILSLASKRSLVIIDELGRGTSPHEGIGVAQAVAEELIAIGAPTFFATHFHELASTLGIYPGVSSQHLSVGRNRRGRQDGRFDLVFHHRLAEGPSQEKRYGIAIASTSALPPELIDCAKEMADRLERKATLAEANSQSKRVAQRRKEVLKLHAQLQQVQRSCTLSDMRPLLASIQRDFVTAMAATYEDADEDESRDGGDTAMGSVTPRASAAAAGPAPPPRQEIEPKVERGESIIEDDSFMEELDEGEEGDWF